MEYNTSSPRGQRTHGVKVKCTNCFYPMYVDVKKDDVYGILLSSYLISGGYGYTMIEENLIDREYLGKKSIEYLKPQENVGPNTISFYTAAYTHTNPYMAYSPKLRYTTYLTNVAASYRYIGHRYSG